MPARSSSTKGFKQAASLITKRVKEASETRGFAQSRLLTHWEEVAGKDTAKIAQPVKVRVCLSRQEFEHRILLLGRETDMGHDQLAKCHMSNIEGNA